jgi:LysM repeat protein
MLNRNSFIPILFAISISLALAPHLLGAGDALPTKATTPTNAAPSPVAPPSPTSLPAPITTERPATYTVVSGDTLWDLSHKFNCSIKALKTLNKLKKNALKPGQVLQIPPPKDEKPVTSPPAAKPTASVKPKPVSPASQPQTASHSTIYPHAQPVQDFDIPASTFASCPTPPSVSEPDETPSVSPSPAPAVAKVPVLRALPVTASELTGELSLTDVSATSAGSVVSMPSTRHSVKTNQAQSASMAKATPASAFPLPKLTSRTPAPDPLITTPANEWGGRFLLAARDLGNRGINYDESWRPPGEARSWDMDCSNTARYIYKITTGIQLPRTASDQYYYLHLQNKAWDVPQVSSGFADCNFLRHNLKPGDLLFWENTYKPERQPPITHVMVFLGTNAKGDWIMAGSQTGKGGEHNRSHGGPDIYVFNPTKPCGGYTAWLGMVHHQGRFCAYGRPLEADKAKLAVAANN